VEKGHVEENGRYICDPRSDAHGEQIARDHNIGLVKLPERWMDVTEDCMFCEDGAILGPKKPHGGSPIIGNIRQGEGLQGYRLRKVQLSYPSGASFPWAFIVEKREEL
jgi:hypothetical protein